MILQRPRVNMLKLSATINSDLLTYPLKSLENLYF